MRQNNDRNLDRMQDESRGGSVHQEVSAIQMAVEKVTQNYLETLEALSTVYDAASGFSQLFDSSSIAYFTLTRILESLEIGCGAIYLESGGVLRFEFDTERARELLKEERIEDVSLEGQALFCNGSSAIRYLRPEAGSRNVLLAPVVAAQRRLGIVVVFSERQRPFTTKDLKLVKAVTSQAAIALSGAQHLDQSLVERQKLRSVIEDNGGGIVVLSPDGRTVLTNPVARDLLGLAPDRSEGFSLLEELAGWKLSREPESLVGEGPSELALEMACGSGGKSRLVSVVGRRVRATDGSLASIVLTLQDVSKKHHGERIKEGLLALLSGALRQPVESLRDSLADAPGDAKAGAVAAAQLRPALDQLLVLSERLRSYVGLLDESWPASGKVDVHEVVGAVREDLTERHASRAPRVDLELDPSAERAGVSDQALRTILENLLENAIEFGPLVQPAVRLSVRRAAPSRLLIQVADRLSDDLAAAQVRFLCEQGDGDRNLAEVPAQLPIRLAVVQEIVHRVGGTVDASRAPGGGTLISVELPLGAGAAATETGTSWMRRQGRTLVGADGSGPARREPGARSEG